MKSVRKPRAEMRCRLVLLSGAFTELKIIETTENELERASAVCHIAACSAIFQTFGQKRDQAPKTRAPGPEP